MKWSNEQLKAIESEFGNYLVSAGAGSGKTAVLTERVYYLIKKGYKISRFLIMTFTNAASAEMKSRIRSKLLADEELKEMAAEIENSHIETFDSFASFIVKKYASKVDINKDFVILDQGIEKIKIRELINRKFAELYETDNKEFIELVETYCRKDDDILVKQVMDLFSVATSQIDSDAFYDDYINKFFTDEYISSRIKEEYDNEISKLNYLISLAEQLENVDDADAIISFLSSLKARKNYDSLVNAMNDETNSFPKKPKDNAGDKEFRDLIRNEYNELKKSNYGSSSYIRDSYLKTRKFVSQLVNVAKGVDHELWNYKKKINAFSFKDISRLALNILSIPEVGKEMADCFDFIMIDEYQDTNDIQEEVVSILNRNNVYMVGDIKQSIYRFRNANCDIFQDKYEKYSKSENGTKIDLNTSYRSRKEVVDMINNIFSVLMNKDNNPIDYVNGHIFSDGLTDYYSNKEEDVTYGIKAYEYELDENEDKVEKEISIICDDIIHKINRQEKVFDKEQKSFRPCKYKDFAIIIDRGTTFEDYKRMFSIKGIPLQVIDDEKIIDTEVSLVIKSLYRLFYYTLKKEFYEEYEHAFVSVSRSFLMEESDKDIYTICKSKLYPSTELQYKINKVVDRYKNSSLYETMRGLYEEFELYYKLTLIPQYENNVRRIESLLDIAKNMDAMMFSFEDLNKYFFELEENDEDIKIPSVSTATNAVTLINIHKSKGLEFPIIYFSGLSKKFNRMSINSSYLTNKNFGLLLPLTDDDSQSSLFNHLFRVNELTADIEEKLRLIYVALTRVREQGILLVDKDSISAVYNIKKVSSFMGLISLVYNKIHSEYYEFKNEQLLQNGGEFAGKTIEFRRINIDGNIVEKRRASKESSDEIDESLLEFGTMLHYLLEVADYESKDLSFIKDDKFKRYVGNVLNSPLFSGVKNEDLLHEYNYYDEINGVHGIIDCLVNHNDYIDIVDFKLKNISDEKYDEQLRTYKSYIKTITSKPIKMHLISAITGEVREIE